MQRTVAYCKYRYSITVAGAASDLPTIVSYKQYFAWMMTTGTPTSRLISPTTVDETPEVLLPAQYRGRPLKLQARQGG
jgi:hypothetical protein